MRTYQHFVNGKWIDGQNKKHTITNPELQKPCAEVSLLTASQVLQAIESSDEAFQKSKHLSRFKRAQLLEAISQGIATRKDQFAELICEEAGKPITVAQGEVTRAIGTFLIAAEETKNFVAEIVALDRDAGGRDYADARVDFVPLGPVFGITPFNFPLNLIAHKVAPALAVGASVMIKPPPQAPGAGFLLAQVFEEAAQKVSDSRETIPPSMFQVFQADPSELESIFSDPRIAIVSFTGSHTVGSLIAQKAAQKKVVLELGGNAAVIVDESADLNRAADRIVFGAFVYAGQVCISVQRVYIHESRRAEFEKLLCEKTEKFAFGGAKDPKTLCGPLIDKQNVDRVHSWIQAAVQNGAKILTGGKTTTHSISPTILTNVPDSDRLSCDEVFGPVMVLNSFKTHDEVIQKINSSRFGLQAGIFTNSRTNVEKIVRNLDVGGMIINDVPTVRMDQMPYGGVKDSGRGREGLRYAMEEFCSRKVIVEWIGN